MEAWDEALRARLDAGDEEAVGEAFDRYGSLVYGLAHRVTGSGSAAEDVVQEVFVGLWRFPERFDPGRGSLRTFLCIQARCRALDLLRRDMRRSDTEHRQGRLSAPATDVPADPAGEAEAAITAGLVRSAIEQLPSDQRAVIELAYFGGRSHSEVASELGIPVGTVKGRLRLAYAKLRRLISPELAGMA